MKSIFYLILCAAFLFANGAFAQVEDSTPVNSEEEMPAEVAVTPSVQTNVKKAVVTRAANTDTVKGNAGRVVEFVPTAGSCQSGWKSEGIVNNSTTRALMARVDVIVTFGGRMSKKSKLIDNLAPGETRYVGCSGCIDNRSGKTCTTYKIIAAAYK